ncbi:MAG: hypothetical protein R3C56_10315 [Pirellulaceae bacterium]
MLVESYAVDRMTAVMQQALLPLLSTAKRRSTARENDCWFAATLRPTLSCTKWQRPWVPNRQQAGRRWCSPIRLEHAAATNVKLLLDQIVRDATVLADDKLRQVVVTGSLKLKLKSKRPSIKSIAQEACAGVAEIRSYDAGQLTASALLTTLQAMWPSMQLTVDGVSNQVVASGTPEEHEQLEAAFEQLTSAPGGDAQLAKTYSVPFGEMSTLPSVLKQLAPRALISSDPVSRTVTVWAHRRNKNWWSKPWRQLIRQHVTRNSRLLTWSSSGYGHQTSLRTCFLPQSARPIRRRGNWS